MLSLSSGFSPSDSIAPILLRATAALPVHANYHVWSRLSPGRATAVVPANEERSSLE